MGKQSIEYTNAEEVAFNRNEPWEKEYKYRVVLQNNNFKIRKFFDEYDDAYTYLMRLRFLHTLDPVEDKGTNEDNFITLIKNTDRTDSLGGESLIRFGVKFSLELFKQKLKDKEL